MGSSHVWKPTLYDEKLGFVSKYGKGVVELLNAQQGEQILDLGCGTGDLSHEIAQSGAYVLGMDYSAQMIEQASNKYPENDFRVGNAEQFTLDQPVDSVFSNAALHWVKNASSVVASIWNALKPGGRFVAEFGGQGNCDTIVKSIYGVLGEYGVDAEGLNPWYFPSIGEYSSLLEQQGFRVTYAVHFDRPTLLQDGENGLLHWLSGLAADEFFQGFNATEKAFIFDKISHACRTSLFRDGAWYADYKRLRIVAIK
ncbi:class I SAM-dependent methyltransferase [Paenibacillus anaericanus]|uniref:Class I SAM-dependent methyltransferase n=1 Tax=Paenibacillus anaericanus TaxID=170367 RepID=A0A433Y4I9_9BACL|nr:class I SAM-dependent methyltransferase [Paenibacillus anaericanus]RUT43242.1 class I SAM-dependent methyltransferase [Paenibacillus anaericanus]